MLACVGCVPGFDRFTVVEPDGAAPGADGGARDGGARDGGRCEGLLCGSRCEELLDAVLAQADFGADTGDFTLRPALGEGALEDGHLVLASPETWLLSLEQYGFGAVAACAEVELGLATVDDASGFLFGLRGPEHGALLRMRPAAGRLELVTFEPAVTLVDAAPLAVPTGAPARYELLVFVGAGAAHAEARRLDGGGMAAVHGPYGGARMPLELELSFFAPDVARARVDRLVVGTPSAEARAVLAGE